MAQSLNRNQLIRDAFEDLGVIPYGQDVSAEQVAKGARKLDMLLAALQNVHNFQTRITIRNFATVAGTATYILQGTSVMIENVTRLKDNVYTPLDQMFLADYEGLSDKTSQGVPDKYLVKYPYDGGTITLNPVPDGVYTVYYTSHEEFTTLGADDTIALRAKWYKYLGLQLAVDLAPWVNREDKLPSLMLAAKQAKDEAMTHDVEGRLMRVKPSVQEVV